MVKSDSQTLNAEELYQFDQIADQWWDENGPFRPLHQQNSCRLRFIKYHLEKHFFGLSSPTGSLKGITILDIGCGGGLLCEPLARLGAHVTGLDASPQAIQTAKNHAQKMGLEIDYHVGTVESFQNKKFDVVLTMEIIEHVDNPSFFIQASQSLLSEKGLFFLSTLNRTCLSYWGGIIAAESILRWVPRGTHQWHRFVKPAEVAAWLREGNLVWRDLKGMQYNPFYYFSPYQQPWTLSNSLKINYIGCAARNS